MSTTFTQPPQSTVQYPDYDGQPLSENTLQFKWIVLIKEGLETLFRRDCNVFVAGDLLWYPEEGKPKIRQAPDVMVVLGRPKRERGSYKQWEEDGENHRTRWPAFPHPSGVNGASRGRTPTR